MPLYMIRGQAYRDLLRNSKRLDTGKVELTWLWISSFPWPDQVVDSACLLQVLHLYLARGFKLFTNRVCLLRVSSCLPNPCTQYALHMRHWGTTSDLTYELLLIRSQWRSILWPT